jgi:hypothetical protein
MLMLGESVLSLLISPLSTGFDYYKIFFCGIVTIVLLEYLHFKSQPHEPDEHALRRSKKAGFIFYILMQVYSVSLVILGTCYKMFLYEIVYENNDPNGTRMLFPLLERLLASGQSSALRFETQDRRQRIANFFSGSLAVVWFCLDAMSLAHRGFANNMERLQDKVTHKKKLYKVALIAMRVALIAFIATLSLYVTEPAELSIIGLCGVLAQLTLRALGTLAFPFDDEAKHEEEEVHRIASYAKARLHETEKDRGS